MAHHMWLTKPRLRPIGLTSVPQGDNASAGLRQFTQTGQADLLLAELDVLNQTGCVWRGSPPPPAPNPHLAQLAWAWHLAFTAIEI